jgi:hypothetical protein
MNEETTYTTPVCATKKKHNSSLAMVAHLSNTARSFSKKKKSKVSKRHIF